ncbi:hypothetical protein D3C71_153470 [compost metagenome]
MTTQTNDIPILTASLSQISDLALKPLDWTKSRNIIDKPRYDATVFGREYLVSQNDNGSWHFHAGSDFGSNNYRSAEEALTAAEDDYKAFVRGFLAETVEAFEISDALAGDARLYDADHVMADGGDSRMTAAEEVLAWILIEKIGVPDDIGYSPQEAQDIIVTRIDQAKELDEIDSMLREGQGDDEGAQILPDFREGSSVYAKVEACLHLLERRRDALDPALAAKVASAARIIEYLDRRRKAHGTVYEEIHSYDLTREGGVRLLASDIEALVRYPSPYVDELREALAWYGDNARLARLVHSGGDLGRHALAADGGKRARAILARTNPDKEEV